VRGTTGSESEGDGDGDGEGRPKGYRKKICFAVWWGVGLLSNAQVACHVQHPHGIRRGDSLILDGSSTVPSTGRSTISAPLSILRSQGQQGGLR